jgi:hypothetical protein
VKVAEGIDVEDVGEAGGEAEVLQEAREHVPWVALERVEVNDTRERGK